MILSDKARRLFPFEPRTLDLDGLSYRYVDEGEGRPILMVHGNPTWSFYYRELIRATMTTHRAVAVDHIGCGRSDKPQEYPYRLARHVDNLERLVLELDLREITLVVHDWGGPIGLGVAVRHPERFSKLVIMNTAAFTSEDMPWVLRLARVPVLGDLLVRGLNAFVLGTLLFGVADTMRITPAIREGYLAPYDSWANRIATLRFVQDIPMTATHPSYDALLEIEHRLSNLADKPAMLLWGDRDFVFTENFLNRFRQLFPGARVHRFRDAGHLVAEEAYDRILPLLRDFLE